MLRFLEMSAEAVNGQKVQGNRPQRKTNFITVLEAKVIPGTTAPEKLTLFKFNEQIRNLTKKNQALRSQIEKHTEVRKDLEEQCEAKQPGLKAVKSKIDELVSKSKEITKKADEITKKLAEFNAQNKSAKPEASKANGKEFNTLAELNEYIKTLTNKLQKQVTSTYEERQIASQIKRLEERRADVQKKENDNKKLKLAQKANEVEASTLLATRSELYTEKDAIRKEMQKLIAEKETILNSTGDQRQALKTVKEQIGELIGTAKATTEKIGQLIDCRNEGVEKYNTLVSSWEESHKSRQQSSESLQKLQEELENCKILLRGETPAGHKLFESLNSISVLKSFLESLGAGKNEDEQNDEDEEKESEEGPELIAPKSRKGVNPVRKSKKKKTVGKNLPKNLSVSPDIMHQFYQLNVEVPWQRSDIERAEKELNGVEIKIREELDNELPKLPEMIENIQKEIDVLSKVFSEGEEFNMSTFQDVINEITESFAKIQSA